MTEKIYSALEAAARLGVDDSRIRILCRQGRLGQTHGRVGRAWLITESEIKAYIKAGPAKSGPPKKDE